MPGSTTEDEEEEMAPMTGAAAAPAEEGVPVAAEQVELALDDEPDVVASATTLASSVGLSRLRSRHFFVHCCFVRPNAMW